VYVSQAAPSLQIFPPKPVIHLSLFIFSTLPAHLITLSITTSSWIPQDISCLCGVRFTPCLQQACKFPQPLNPLSYLYYLSVSIPIFDIWDSYGENYYNDSLLGSYNVQSLKDVPTFLLLLLSIFWQTVRVISDEGSRFQTILLNLTRTHFFHIQWNSNLQRVVASINVINGLIFGTGMWRVLGG